MLYQDLTILYTPTQYNYNNNVVSILYMKTSDINTGLYDVKERQCILNLISTKNLPYTNTRKLFHDFTACCNRCGVVQKCREYGFKFTNIDLCLACTYAEPVAFYNNYHTTSDISYQINIDYAYLTIKNKINYLYRVTFINDQFNFYNIIKTPWYSQGKGLCRFCSRFVITKFGVSCNTCYNECYKKSGLYNVFLIKSSFLLDIYINIIQTFFDVKFNIKFYKIEQSKTIFNITSNNIKIISSEDEDEELLYGDDLIYEDTVDYYLPEQENYDDLIADFSDDTTSLQDF
jgi:hypothetical protein